MDTAEEGRVGQIENVLLTYIHYHVQYISLIAIFNK